MILPSLVNLQDTNWPAEILLQFHGCLLRETGGGKKEQSRIFDVWLQTAVTDHFPISASTANCDFPFRELFPAFVVMPRSMPCLTCDMLMRHSRNNPLGGLHESSISGCYIHGLFTHLPILILLPPVAVIVKESTAWLPWSSLWHWMQKLTLLHQILWYV